MSEDQLTELSTQERAELLGLDPRIGHPATLWGPGAYRVREWLRLGRPAADRQALVFVGDETVERAVRGVLDRLPEPVAHRIVTTCMIVGTGVDGIGWVGEHPDLPAASPALLMALAVADARTIGHELADAWFKETPSPKAPPTARARADASERAVTDLAVAAVANNDIAWLEEFLLAPERAADAAASLWLGTRVDTCGPRRLAEIRAGIFRRAAERAPLPIAPSRSPPPSPSKERDREDEAGNRSAVA